MSLFVEKRTEAIGSAGGVALCGYVITQTDASEQMKLTALICLTVMTVTYTIARSFYKGHTHAAYLEEEAEWEEPPPAMPPLPGSMAGPFDGDFEPLSVPQPKRDR